MTDAPIHLISAWPLKDGFTSQLKTALVELAQRVRDDEPGTLSYAVFVGAPSVGSGATSLGQIADPQQRTVTFVETYADADAFLAHLHGPAFTAFLEAHLGHFYEDPDRPGQPAAATTFLSAVASTHR